MKRLATVVTMLMGLGLLMASVASAQYCKTITTGCSVGQVREICCNEPPSDPTTAPLPADPNNPAGGLTICGEVDTLIGGCIRVSDNPVAQGCVQNIGLALTQPDPNNLPSGAPDTNCANLAVDACEQCGCATTSACH